MSDETQQAEAADPDLKKDTAYDALGATVAPLTDDVRSEFGVEGEHWRGEEGKGHGAAV